MDPGSADELFPIVYDELRRLAGHLRGGRDVANPTSLVHEAYLRLASDEGRAWDRLHFQRVAARAMRHVLVDRARRRGSAKRGGGWERVTLDGLGADGIDILELSDALERLAEADPVGSEVVDLRFFGGLSGEETAEALGCSERTVDRAWRRARALLQVLLGK